MFNSIRRMFWAFRPGVFRFYDGRRWRNADPLEVYYTLFSNELLGPIPEHHLKQASVYGDQKSAQLIAKAGRQAFSIKTLDEGGLSGLEILALVRAFVDYCEGVKKNIGTNVSWQPLWGATSDAFAEIENASSPTDFSPPSFSDVELTPSDKGQNSPSLLPSEEASPATGGTQ